MFILIIEDEKDEKLGSFLEYLNNNQDIDFVLMEDEKSAREYLAKHSSKVDAIITDLGLSFDKKSEQEKYNPFAGIEIIDCMQVRNRRIPVIINSAAELGEQLERRISDIDYTHIESIAEQYSLNPLAVSKMIEGMQGKATKVDEEQAKRFAATNNKPKTKNQQLWDSYRKQGD